MNKAKKNIVIVGFNEIERNSIAIPSLAEPYYNGQKIYYFYSLSEATKHQGYMLIINNKENKSIIEFDKKYRKTFNRFEKVIIFNEKYENQSINKWSRVEKIGRDIFNLDSFSLGEDWDIYKYEKEKEVKKYLKYNKIKQDKLDRLYKYISNYKTRKTNEIADDLKINKRTIQRYMQDLNNIYHNIGYDYSLNEWYFIW